MESSRLHALQNSPATVYHQAADLPKVNFKFPWVIMSSYPDIQMQSVLDNIRRYSATSETSNNINISRNNYQNNSDLLSTSNNSGKFAITMIFCDTDWILTLWWIWKFVIVLISNYAIQLWFFNAVDVLQSDSWHVLILWWNVSCSMFQITVAKRLSLYEEC